jgi:hypothetical protein
VKKNHACAVTRPRAFDRGWNAEGSAGIGEGGDVFPPGTLVEINGQKPTPGWKDVRASAEQGSEQLHLARRGVRHIAFRGGSRRTAQGCCAREGPLADAVFSPLQRTSI